MQIPPMPELCIMGRPTDRDFDQIEAVARWGERGWMKVADLLPYVHHHPKCFKGGNDNATVIDCTCGFDQILNR